MPDMKPGESYKSWMGRCVPYVIKNEGKKRNQAAGKCYGMWKNRKKKSKA